MIRNQKGMSILELVVALAMSAIVGYTSLVIMDSLNHQRAVSKKLEAKNSLMHFLFNLGERATPLIRLQDFYFKRTIWRGSDLSAIPQFIAAHGGSQRLVGIPSTHGGGTINRDSWTIDLVKDLDMSRAGNSEGLIASRCVSKVNFERTSWTLANFQSELLVPILKGSGSSTDPFQVACCFLEDNRFRNCRNLNTDSTNRVAIFHFSNNNIRVYPLINERKHAANGAGFMIFFNRENSPNLASIQLFIVDNECQRVTDYKVNAIRGECDRNTKVQSKIIEREVISNVHNSGIMRLGR